jgi:hypothetical protein
MRWRSSSVESRVVAFRNLDDDALFLLRRYPVYESSELDRWAEARIGPPQRSTSEVDPA